MRHGNRLHSKTYTDCRTYLGRHPTPCPSTLPSTQTCRLISWLTWIWGALPKRGPLLDLLTDQCSSWAYSHRRFLSQQLTPASTIKPVVVTSSANLHSTASTWSSQGSGWGRSKMSGSSDHRRFPQGLAPSPVSRSLARSTTYSPLTSSPIAVPSPPRCLTPYPTQLSFLPSSPSPLLSPAVLLAELDADCADPHTPCPPHSGPSSTSSSIREEKSRRPDHARATSSKLAPPVFASQSVRTSIPINLQMSTLIPDNTTIAAVSGSPPSSLPGSLGDASRSTECIQLSPSARKLMAEKENRRIRPGPIRIPFTSPVWRVSPLSSTIITARAGTNGDHGRFSLRTEGAAHVEGRRGSVPLPKTPLTPSPIDSRTAVPLTARRIGVVKPALRSSQ